MRTYQKDTLSWFRLPTFLAHLYLDAGIGATVRCVLIYFHLF